MTPSHSRLAPHLRRSVIAALALLMLSFAPRASADSRVVSPFGDASVDVYLVTLTDAVFVSQAAITVRRSDGACSINLFASTSDGRFADRPRYVSGGGDDRISFWNDPNWSPFTCGSTTVLVKSMAWTVGNADDRLKVNAGAGNDIVHAYENDLFIVLDAGDDQFVVDHSPNKRPMGQVVGESGRDVIYVTGIQWGYIYGGEDNDWFCGSDNGVSGVIGDGGYDRSALRFKTINAEKIIEAWECPPPPP